MIWVHAASTHCITVSYRAPLLLHNFIPVIHRVRLLTEILNTLRSHIDVDEIPSGLEWQQIDWQLQKLIGSLLPSSSGLCIPLTINPLNTELNPICQ